VEPARFSPSEVSGVPAPRPSLYDAGARFLSYLRRHPILCLALLTPGIPEYLSTSSSLLTIGLNPAFFVIQMVINVAQYTAGALLVREALLRWRKGWASAFLLGAAYGITEEGLGDSTLVNSTHGADGVLGWFGRYAGINWAWSTGVLAFHIILSIGIPILLLGLALPETRGRSLLSTRGIALAFLAVAASTFTENRIVYADDHFWLGVPLLVTGLVLVAVLAYLAYRVPANLLAPGLERARLSPRAATIVGFIVFPIAFVLEYGFVSTSIPPAGLIALEVVVFAVLLEYVRRNLGRSGNEYPLVHLALGFLLWQSVFGVLLTIGFPYTLPLIALVVVFFIRLRRRYHSTIRSPRPPVGATT
jgi:hypothetical protein